VGALVHRAHLHDALFGGIPAGVVRLNSFVKEISVSSTGVKATTENGQTFEADILVGADGIHSPVRRQLFGEVKPRYMGYRSHRMIVDNVPGVRDFIELLGR